MRRLSTLLALTWLLVPSVAPASALYTAPEGCTAIATLRLPGCIVRQVSRCAAGNIVDGFRQGVYTGRAYYEHPTLFLRYEAADGYVTGHKYGPGTPKLGDTLSADETFTYSRDVYRSRGEAQNGDTGIEEMVVGPIGTIDLGARQYRVRTVRFSVSNPATGYLYRERAFILEDPGLTIGVTGVTYDSDGKEESHHNTLPETLSLPGEPGFRSYDPAPSCLPST